jgi:hypothetical protein
MTAFVPVHRLQPNIGRGRGGERPGHALPTPAPQDLGDRSVKALIPAAMSAGAKDRLLTGQPPSFFRPGALCE